MTLSAKILERFRVRLARLVEKERKASGCLTLATKRVAGKIGMSPMWVRRVLGNYGSVKIQAHHYVAVLMQTFGAVRRTASRFSESAKSIGASFKPSDLSARMKHRRTGLSA